MCKKPFFKGSVLAAMLASALLSLPASVASAATLTVTTTADDLVPGDGACTLREALANANSDSDLTGGDCPPGSGADRIILPAGHYTLLLGVFTVTDELTIDGDGSSSCVIDGNGTDRIFLVSDTTFALSAVTLTGGFTEGNGGAIKTASFDGGVNPGIEGPTDQRGELRIFDEVCQIRGGFPVVDIGAVERQAFHRVTLPGNVNLFGGAITDALFVNGSSGGPGRVVTVGRNTSFDISLEAPPAGPASGTFLLLIWPGPPVNTSGIVIDGLSVGCFANPTPLNRGEAPQPSHCIRGAGIPDAACRGVNEVAGPTAFPFSLTSPGFSAPATLTIQAIVEDASTLHPSGFSVSNAVTLMIE